MPSPGCGILFRPARLTRSGCSSRTRGTRRDTGSEGCSTPSLLILLLLGCGVADSGGWPRIGRTMPNTSASCSMIIPISSTSIPALGRRVGLLGRSPASSSAASTRVGTSSIWLIAAASFLLVRWRLDIAYDGTAFSGWAAQPGLRTVQAELEGWLVKVLRLDAPVSLVCAGRTDAGVHARGQVAHVDLPHTCVDDEGQALTRRLHRALPDDLVIRRISAAPPGFDARFSAIWRRYVYRLSDGETPPDPLVRNHVLRITDRVDIEAMNSAVPELLGL